MDEIEGGGGGIRLGKKIADKGVSTSASGEVDYKTKAGTAWSHSFLNQKPWHPLSYPNQRRKWIAEQTHANRQQRADEVAREFAQEQEFFRQSALFSKKEKEKVEMMKAVSFMYVRPPGYNAESAKAAEVADERKKLDQNNGSQEPTSSAPVIDAKPDKDNPGGDKKARPKDVFGRALPTEEEFEVLKNAPRLETGMPGRVKPFGIEIRNVRCVRCGTFGHQSGDRECPLKDVIMPNEESRLKRDDPLTAIIAHTDPSEPLKWELKQKPGISPPRGGFQLDDPNQQIVAEEEIFDEYGGFLSGGDIPALLANFSTKKSKKHSKHKSRCKRHSSGAHSEVKHQNREDRLPSSPDFAISRERQRRADSEDDRERKRSSRRKHKHKHKKRDHSESSRSDESDMERHKQCSYSSDSEDVGRKRSSRSKHKHKKGYHSESSKSDRSDREHHRKHFYSSDSEDRGRKRSTRSKHKHKMGNHSESSESDDSDVERHRKHSYSSDSEDRERKRSKHKHKKKSDSERNGSQCSSDSETDRERKRKAKGNHKGWESHRRHRRRRN